MINFVYFVKMETNASFYSKQKIKCDFPNCGKLIRCDRMKEHEISHKSERKLDAGSIFNLFKNKNKEKPLEPEKTSNKTTAGTNSFTHEQSVIESHKPAIIKKFSSKSTPTSIQEKKAPLLLVKSKIRLT